MGSSSSKATVEDNLTSIQSTTNSSMISLSQNCSLAQSVTVNFATGDISGSTVNFQSNAEQVGQVLCLATQDASVSFSTKIDADLQKKLTASAKAGTTLGFSSSDTSVNSTTTAISKVANTVDVSLLQSCLSTQLASFGVKVGNISNGAVLNVTIASSQQAVLDCTAKQTALVSAQTDLAQKVTIDASATSTSGFDLSTLILIAIIIILVLGAIFIGPTLVVKSLSDTLNAVIMAAIGIITTLVTGITGAIFPKAAPTSTNQAPPPYSNNGNASNDNTVRPQQNNEKSNNNNPMPSAPTASTANLSGGNKKRRTQLRTQPRTQPQPTQGKSSEWSKWKAWKDSDHVKNIKKYTNVF